MKPVPACPLKLDICFKSCYFWLDGECQYKEIMAEKHPSEMTEAELKETFPGISSH